METLLFIKTARKVRYMGFCIILSFLFTYNNSMAQGRCDLVSEQCIDLENLGGNGSTVQVPSNTTRLSNDGISICLTPAGTELAPVDIMFVVDQSGSMVWNDPTFYAPTATHAAVQYLADLSSGSQAGLIPFSGEVCNTRAPVSVGNSTSLNTIFSWIDDDLADGTDPSISNPTLYYPASSPDAGNWRRFQGSSGYGCDDTNHGTAYIPPLVEARDVLENSSNSRKAIIFITDGQPGDDYDNWSDANKQTLPPVYSILIGGTYADTANTTSPAGRLVELASLTGGQYYPVEADNPSELEAIMQAVVQEVISPGVPVQTTISNSTNGQLSQSISHNQITNGQYQVVLDEILGLESGLNALTINSISSKNGVPSDTVVYNITIDVSGTPTPNLGDINLPDSLFDITCVEPSSINVVDNLSDRNIITTLGYQSASYGIILDTKSGDDSPEALITSRDALDRLTSGLTSNGVDSFMTTVNFQTTLGGGNVNDAISQARLGDLITVSWYHPRDSADFAQYQLNVQQPQVATPQVSFSNGNPFTSFTEAILYTSTASPVSIYYTLDGSTPSTGSLLYDPNNPPVITQALTLRAIAVKSGWQNSGILTVAVTRTSSASQIAILNQSYQPFENNIVYTSESNFSIQLETNYYGSSSLQAAVTASVTGDVLNISLTSSHITGSNSNYARIYRRASLSIEMDNSPEQTSVLETAAYDTLIINWTNPLDNSDAVADTVFVRPANTEAQIHFSTSSSLADSVSSFSDSDTEIFVIVVDQTIHPDSSYQVELVTDGDVETISLSVVNGNLVGSINMDYGAISQNNGSIQAKLPGDEIQATYTDPVFPSDEKVKSITIGSKSIADPTVEDNGGSVISSGTFFADDTTIYLDVSTAGAQIRYTLDGSTVPSNTVGTLYTMGTPINLTQSTEVRVIAYLENDNIDNFVLSNLVTVSLNDTGSTGLPYANPKTTYFTEDTTVSLNPEDPSDDIFYTLDGSNPDTVASGSTLLYGSSLNISATTTVKFRAANPPKKSSSIVTEVYTKRDSLEAPVATPISGTQFFGDTNVVLSNPTVTNAIIRYTTDGSTPTTNSQRYLGALTFSQPTNLKAVAFNPQGSDAYVKSEVATFTYTPKLPTPEIIPGDSSFGADIFVRLTVETQGATIHYTLDGSNPTASSPSYSQLIQITQTTTLKAIAVKTGWANSDVNSATYTKQFLASSLVLLDGNQQEVEYLTEKNSSFYVILQTSEADLSSVTPLATSLSLGDSEILTLTQVGRSGDYFKYQLEVPFSVISGSPSSNGTMQSRPYDDIVVSWTNPNNGSDVVTDTLSVRPFPIQADMYFSNSLLSSSRLTQYQGSEDSLYLVVKDQAWDLSKNYQVTIISDPVFGTNRSPDTLTLPLTQVGNNSYGIVIPVDKSTSSNTSDNLLQIVKGDKIRASYIDPVDGDNSVTQVNYGSAGEVSAKIMFTNSMGIPLEDGLYYDPAADSVYIMYIDDYTTKIKTLIINVENTKGNGVKTYDALNIELSNPEKQDSIGIWTVSIAMAESETTDKNNSILEIFFMGEITASVQAHSKTGSALSQVSDVLIVAYENEEESVVITDGDGNTHIAREVEEITITVKDQDFTNSLDTLIATVQCLKSGDLVKSVTLIETSKGVYVGKVVKNEEERNSSDSVLSCASDDEIKVSYVDPIYKTKALDSEKIDGGVNQTISFIDSKGNTINNLDEFSGGDFRIKVNAFSESQTEIDTLTVTLVNSNGESIEVKVVETDVYSNEFISEEVDYTFVYKDETAEEGTLVVGKLDEENSHNKGTVTAVLITERDSSSNSLEIEAAYIPVEKSWIVDGNSDGIADSLFIRFKENLTSIPNSILSIDWPGEGENNYTAKYNEDESITEISFFKDAEGNIDSSLILIVLKDNAESFEPGKTQANSSNPPKLTLPSNNIFKGQEVEILDNVAPTILVAERLPSDLGFYKYVDSNGKTRYKQNPDTLIVTFSEDLILDDETGSPWDSLIVFSQSCDKDNGHFLINHEGDRPLPLEPDENGNIRWRFIVTNDKDAYKPTSEGCVWLNPDSRYSDASGNRPSRNEVAPVGEEDAKFINESKIFNPVVGVNLNENNLAQTYIAYGALDDDGNITLPNVEDGSFVQLWIPPKGLDSDGSISEELLSQQCNNQVNQVEEEDFRNYPQNCLSSVFVETLGGYIAEVEIYDHLGKFIHRSVQSFGKCGETANENRLGPNGFRSWLVWNMKDKDENFVGSGVYVWKVKYRALNNEVSIPTAIYKQGIARSNPPDKNCADN